MFWDKIEPIITPRLNKSIEAAYEIFSSYRLSGLIIYCDCPVCMTKETAEKLSRLPLKEISHSLLGEYTNSAHGYDREKIEPEFKYFLPRYLDLIAHCRPPSPLDLQGCLSRLEGYREHWPAHEVETIDTFFDAFVEACLGQTGLLKWPVGYRLAFDMGEVLEMIVDAGGDLGRALDVIDAGPDPDVALHLASMRGKLTYRDGQPAYYDLDAEGQRAASAQIGAWLERETVIERIIGATDLLDDPGHNEILDLAI